MASLRDAFSDAFKEGNLVRFHWLLRYVDQPKFYDLEYILEFIAGGVLLVYFICLHGMAGLML